MNIRMHSANELPMELISLISLISRYALDDMKNRSLGNLSRTNSVNALNNIECWISPLN